MFYEDSNANDGQAKADLFNKFFFKSFNDNTYQSPDITTFVNDNLSYLQVTEYEVLKILQELDVTKATGPDNLSAYFFKNTSYITS